MEGSIATAMAMNTMAMEGSIAVASTNVTAPLMLLSMVGCCVVCCSLPAASSAVQICQPPRCVVGIVNNDCYCRRQRLPCPLPQSMMTITKSQWLLFVVDNGDEDHRRLQRQLMVVAAMTSLPPPSLTTTG
jgi:hypothetical protein